MATSREAFFDCGPGGPTLPLVVVELAVDLERRGVLLARVGERLVARPNAVLSDEDRAAITRWKGHLLALVDHVDRRPHA